jgi:hypothetical protein
VAEIAQWEYRSITLGSFWNTPKDEEIEAVLNELGADGWEVVSVFSQHSTNQFRYTFKRPLSGDTRRRRSGPG